MDSISILNNSILEDGGIATIERDINYLLYNQIIDPSFTLSEADSTLIYYVGGLCPIDYGSIVFSARRFLNSDQLINFEEDSCSYNDPIILNFESKFDNTNFIIFPNPTNGVLKILSADIITQITLYDINGSIQKVKLEDGNLDLSNLKDAVYFIRIISSSGYSVFKKVLLLK
ncbi:MAG: T9SS type A sorting domain-containing protein [Saprospiraceae bacterium]|jgi:hypothetical protein